MKKIHHVLDVASPVSSVWPALTEKDGLSQWWSTQVVAGPPSIGTLIHFTFGGDFNPVMEITDLEERHCLGWRCIDGHANWNDNNFTFELVPRDDNMCRLRFTQDYAVELSDDDYGIYNFNWGYYLESLRLFCTTGQGKPYDPGPG